MIQKASDEKGLIDDSEIALCKSCGAEVEDKYCSYCGQGIHITRITWKTLVESIFRSLFASDRGIIYTLKQLTINPGKILSEYIEGRRVVYFNPISLMILLAGIYDILFTMGRWSLSIPLKEIGTDLLGQSTSEVNIIFHEIANAVINLFRSSSFIFLVVIFPFAFSLKRTLRKVQKHNFPEYIFISSYIFCQFLIVNFILSPLRIYALKNELDFYSQTVVMIYILILIYDIYSYTFGKESIYKKSRKSKKTANTDKATKRRKSGSPYTPNQHNTNNLHGQHSTLSHRISIQVYNAYKLLVHFIKSIRTTISKALPIIAKYLKPLLFTAKTILRFLFYGILFITVLALLLAGITIGIAYLIRPDLFGPDAIDIFENI